MLSAQLLRKALSAPDGEAGKGFFFCAFWDMLSACNNSYLWESTL